MHNFSLQPVTAERGDRTVNHELALMRIEECARACKPVIITANRSRRGGDQDPRRQAFMQNGGVGA